MLPLILVAILCIGLWRSMQMYRRIGGTGTPPTGSKMFQTTRSKRIAKRVGIVVTAWIAVTGLVAFYRIEWALFAGMIVVVIGAVWIWKTADPMRVDMDELDRELMQLLEDES